MYGDQYDATYPENVGHYPMMCSSGGGYRYDRVLEWRVWRKDGDGELALYSFPSFQKAQSFMRKVSNDIYTHLVVLVEQKKWYKMNEKGSYVDDEGRHYSLSRKTRITEWAPEWLLRNSIELKKIPIKDRART